MNLMIRVSDHIYVVADDVARVEVLDDRTARVYTKSGSSHTLVHSYGESVWTTVEKFNEAVSRARAFLAGVNHELKAT